MKITTPLVVKINEIQKRYTNPFLAACLITAGLYFISTHNYLLFHTLVELFGIIIATTAFVLAWNARRMMTNGALLFIGISLLFVAGFDLLHTLTYQGVGVFGFSGANLPTQLWVAARITQGVSFMIAPLMLHRSKRPQLQLAICGVISGVILLSIYPWQIFPAAYIDGPGGGITPFKIVAEYSVIGFLFISIGLFTRIRNAFDPEIWTLLILSNAVNILAEFVFTRYLGVSDTYNLVGHLLKGGASYLIYRAVIETGFSKPQAALYYELAQSEKALRISEASERQRLVELEAIMDAVPAVVWITKDPQAKVIKGNRAAVDLLRMKPNENLSLTAPPGEEPTHFKVFWKGRELSPQELPLQVSASSGLPLRNYEEMILFDSGEEIHLLGNVTPLLDENGKPAGAVAVFIDISARKRAEQEVHAYSRQLEQSNRELQEFAFVASHDLQEPLRKIQAFSERLASQLADMLDPESGDYLERINRASQRMRMMIEDLLSLSRVTTSGRPFVQVDLNEVAKETLSDLELRIVRTQGRVVVDDLPVVEADPVQMHQLLLNLVANALKFYRDEVDPQVKITSSDSPENEFKIITVSDNGIGFDEQYTERIFQPFQRLHGVGKYEGSGIGLAVCRKIVERHGGTITAESTPDEGSAFIVKLPVKQARQRKLA